jgi:hypothetical protein
MEQCPTKEINNINLNLKTKHSIFFHRKTREICFLTFFSSYNAKNWFGANKDLLSHGNDEKIVVF